MEENFVEGKKEKEESCRPLIRDAGRYGLDGTSGQELHILLTEAGKRIIRE